MKRILIYAVTLVATAVLIATSSEIVFAAPSDCCIPKMELFCSQINPPQTKEGDAYAYSEYRCPSVLLGHGRATAWNDEGDAFSNKNHDGTAVMKLEVTPACSGWSYKWKAEGKLLGLMEARARSAWPGSAAAWFSMFCRVTQDLSMQGGDKAAASCTSGGPTLSVSIGASGPGGSISWSPQNVNPLHKRDPGVFGDSDAKEGPGREVQVKFKGKEELDHTANNGLPSWFESNALPHVDKAHAATAGIGGARTLLAIYCSGAGMTIVQQWDPMNGRIRTGTSNQPLVDDPGDINWDPWREAEPGEEGGPEEKENEPPAPNHPTGPGWQTTP